VEVIQKRVVEFAVSREADPKLVPGEVLWFEVPRDGIEGRFLVVTAEPTRAGVRYTLVSQGYARKRPGERSIRIEKL
jgi:hypothetical protein